MSSHINLGKMANCVRVGTTCVRDSRHDACPLPSDKPAFPGFMMVVRRTFPLPTSPRRLPAAHGRWVCPSIDNNSAGTNTLGNTLPNGHVFRLPGLSRQVQAHVLRHEGVRSFLSAADSVSFATFRQNVGMCGHNNSHVLRYVEEAIAEGYSSRSILQGLKHPIVNPYGISVPRLRFRQLRLHLCWVSTWRRRVTAMTKDEAKRLAQVRAPSRP